MTLAPILGGRVTHELMAGVWPTFDADPTNTGPEAEFAPIWRDMPKIVYSRTMKRADWNTTVVRDVVAEEVMELKAQPGGDMVLGGADLAATFRRLDLIDEYRLYVHPVVIGRGRPTFPASDVATELRLAETRTFGTASSSCAISDPEVRSTSRDPSPRARPKAARVVQCRGADRGAGIRPPPARIVAPRSAPGGSGAGSSHRNGRRHTDHRWASPTHLDRPMGPRNRGIRSSGRQIR